MRWSTLLCLVALLFPGAGALAQTAGTITGTVTSSTGHPIVAAQVVVQGTARGAVTGANGRYTITDVPPGQHTLRAAIIGYGEESRSVDVAAGATITANFELSTQAVELEGIVAVGYGTQKRADVTGSIASVSAKRLENVPNTRVEQALQAALPGVSVQTDRAGAEQNLDIQIRGRNSILASNSPLIVVDGIPYNGPLSEINPNDVSSIDVLKDASSAAIYGARGSNGVILITTKKGVEGKPRFAYEGYAGVQEAVSIPTLKNGAEFAAFRCQRINDGEDCEQRVWTQTEREGLASGRTTDWLDLALRRGFQQQHNLSFSGGAQGTRYYIAGSLMDVQGVAKNDEFDRATLRVNLNQDVTSWLDMGTSTQLSNTDRSGLPADFGGAFHMSPLGVPFDEEGNQTIYPWPEDPFWANPLQGLLVVDDDVARRMISNNHLEVRLPFIEGLSYRLNGGIDFTARDQGRYYGRDTKVGLGDSGNARVENRTQFDWTLENIVRFARSFGAHDLDLTGLYSAQASELQRERIDALGFPNDVLTYHQANVASLVEPTSEVTDWGLISQMGRLNYSYGGRYLITATARRDGFSGFGREQKYGVFPSLALGWTASNEAFWPFEDGISFLKLRASYGQNGNQAIRPYQTLARLREYSYLNGESAAPGFVPASLSNPNLRWETTTSANFGADFGLFGDRVRGSLDTYSSQTDDLLLDRQISPVHGLTEITENIGEVRNRGIELALSSVNLDRGDFSWSSDFNISANRNEITALYGNGQDDAANAWFVGQPINVNYDYIQDGVWQLGEDPTNSAQPDARPGDLRYRDLNGDGRIDGEDRGFTGDRDPSYLAGLNNTLRYGNISLDVFVHAVQGVTRTNELLELYSSSERRNTVPVAYWTPTNPTNRFPANRFGANPLNIGFFEDASFIRLKDVSLSFDVPFAMTHRIGAERLRLYVNGRNLWTSTEWTGLDPELGDQSAVPLQRLITAGVNMRF